MMLTTCKVRGVFTRVTLLMLILVIGVFPALGYSDAEQEADAKKGEPGPHGKLLILTSYPKKLTDEFRRAFEKKYPEVEVDVLKKKTGAGVKHLGSTRDTNMIDLFWVSAPDAMEILKADGLLESFVPRTPGLPKKVSAYPIHDEEGYYSGFAASGYGIMWNERYLSAKKLPVPDNWEVLATPEYHGHVGMSSPSRSGTTHLAVEAVLQGYGWKEGWNLVQAIGGNLSTVTRKSSHVPKGVEGGEFAAGIVIDFYGLGSRARRYPVDFAYPDVTTIVPASIALVTEAPNPDAAKAFIEFTLSEEGQTLLLRNNIRRLPVRPEIYNRAADDFPNPFEDKKLKKKLKFDVQKSKGRYAVANALFDVLVTYNLSDLKKATRLIQEARVKTAASPKDIQSHVQPLVIQAQSLLNYIPVTETRASEADLVSVFKKKRKKATDKLEGRQAEIELGWQEQVKNNYIQAAELAKKALKMLDNASQPSRLSLAPADK